MPVAMEDVEEAPEQTELDVIEALEIADPDQAIQRYLSIVGKDVPEGERDVAVKEKETAITRVSDLYVKHNKQEDLAALIKNIRPFLSLASKAKGGQIFKGLLDKFLTFETDRAAQVALFFFFCFCCICPVFCVFGVFCCMTMDGKGAGCAFCSASFVLCVLFVLLGAVSSERCPTGESVSIVL
eukprot:m.26277 g.26277  ORF g.26277 m.26277 type:complete len:184 (-) comp8166_c0_seq2:27-578(-)